MSFSAIPTRQNGQKFFHDWFNDLRDAGAAIENYPLRLTTTARDALASPVAGDTIYNTTTNKLNVYNGTAWVAVGSGGAGGINYILNPDAETDLAGWATYKDAAGVSPVNGTGGVSDLVLTRSTSSPLRELASFLLTQPNATNCQGSGVSYAFTIAAADKANVLALSLDFNASSDFVASSGQVGSESHLEFYIYDVTNSALIQVSPKVITAKGANNFKFLGEFQTAANSVSYRLIIHCATTDAPATGFIFKFDNVIIGPREIAYGSADTDLQAYDMVITGSTSDPTKGATTIDQAMYGKSRDHVLLRYDYSQTSAGSAGSGIYLFSLPPGLVADTDKCPADSTGQTGHVGFCEVQNSGNSGSYFGSVFLYDSTHLALFLSATDSKSFASAGPGNFIDLSNTTVVISFTASVPIKGWGTSVQLSQDAETRVVAASASLASNIVVLANNAVSWDVIEYDTHAALNSGRFTAPVSGVYSVCGIFLESTTPTNLFLFLNGSYYKTITYLQTNLPSSYAIDLKLVSGDIIDIRPESNVTVASGLGQSTFAIKRVCGPATIAASEKVACRYSNAVATAITNAAVFVYPTKDFDSHGSYNASTGIFTVQSPGIYAVSAAIAPSGSSSFSTGGDYIQISVAKNTVYKSTGRFTWVYGQGAAVGNPMAQVYGLIDAVAGDEIAIYCDFQGPTSPDSDNSTGGVDCYLQIHKL